MIILTFFAFLAGIVTVLSPCVLPVLPALLSGGAGIGRFRPHGIVLGLTLSFAFFTLALTAIVHATGVSAEYLRQIAIGLIVLFGLTMLFPKLGDWFAEKTSGIASLGVTLQEKSKFAGSGFWSGFFLGMALGLVWTPCAGPILAAITTLVATQAITFKTIFITLAYCLGSAIPLFLIVYGGNQILYSTKMLSRHTETIRRVFGALMIVAAATIALHADVALQQFALQYIPLINIEDNPLVKSELDKLRKNTAPSLSLDGKTKAPDFIGIQEWINSPPLSLPKLQGKVILVDFWTYSCINCVRTLPYLKKWDQDYRDKGLVIVGIHTPEFEFEKNPRNVKDAVSRFEIKYPVGLDNEYKTWQNYNNRYWPAHYLIDQNGLVRDAHFGEGAYLETENAIRSLLGLTPLSKKEEVKSQMQITPETYLGYSRADHYSPEILIKKDQPALYQHKEPLQNDHVALNGSWTVRPEFIQAGDDASLTLNFLANRVYLVMSSPTPQPITILLDGKPPLPSNYTTDTNSEGKILVHEPRMYDILDLKGDSKRHTLTLLFPKDVTPYVFTFGSGDK